MTKTRVGVLCYPFDILRRLGEPIPAMKLQVEINSQCCSAANIIIAWQPAVDSICMCFFTPFAAVAIYFVDTPKYHRELVNFYTFTETNMVY